MLLTLTNIYKIYNSLNSLKLGKFYSADLDSTENSKLSLLIGYLNLFSSLIEEVLKINHFDLVEDNDDEESPHLDMDYYCEKLIETNRNNDIKEVDLFRILSIMIVSQTKKCKLVPIDSKEYKEVITNCNEIIEYKVRSINRDLSNLFISEENVFSSNTDCFDVYETLDTLFSKHFFISNCNRYSE